MSLTSKCFGKTEKSVHGMFMCIFFFVEKGAAAMIKLLSNCY